MKKIKSFTPYIIVFIFFGVILFLSPISGDDWANYLVGKEGIYHSIGNAIGMYFDWEGRFLSRIFINIFTYYKALWNITNSLVIAGIIYYIVRIVKPRNKRLVFFLALFIILLMNIFTFSQIVVWIAGNITYLFPILFLLYYFYRILRKDNDGYVITFILGISNLLIPMFVEHVAGVLVIFNFIINIFYYIKYRKINKKYLVYLLLSMIGLFLMYFSPGNRMRSSIENLEFNRLSLFGKILYNIPNFIYYTFIIYPYLILLMVTSNIYLVKHIVKNKYLKIFMVIYLTIIPISFGIIYLLSNFITHPIFSIIRCDHVVVIGYYISHAIIQFILLFTYSRREKDYLPTLFYFLGMTANGMMLLSPTWGYRTSFLTYLLLAISYIFIIDYYTPERKIVLYFFLGISTLVILFYLILYINVFRAELDRESSIQRQLKNDIIYIERFPSYVNCNINPENEFHMEKFKEYYQIDPDTQVELTDGNWEYLVFYHSKNKASD